MTVLEALVRRCRLLEREGPGDVRSQTALLHQRRDVLAEVIARRADEDVARLEVLALLGWGGDRDQPPALAERAEVVRVEMERARGTADMQASLAQSAVGIEIKNNEAAAREAQARGEAAYVEMTGRAEATKTEAVGLAEAKATEALGIARAAGYREQTQALGQTATALVAVANAVAEGHITVVPEVLSQVDVFVLNRGTGVMRRLHPGPGIAHNGDAQQVRISADGRYVAFLSFASNWVAGDTNNAEDIFVYDTQTDTIERASVGNNEEENPSLQDSYTFEFHYDLSQDGRCVEQRTHTRRFLIPFLYCTR